MRFTPHQISIRRLSSQQVSGTSFTTPKALVSWMGAMQAQDYVMVRWAIGVRLHGTTPALIQRAIDEGQIIRTHVLRPTWHLVSAEDASWMLRLTSPYIKASLKFRQRYLELTPSIVKKGCRIIEKALAASGALTREEIVKELQAAKINTAEQRAVHILLMAELDQLICSGPLAGKKNTFALFADRIRHSNLLHPDQAPGALCLRYFQSHGPATLQDFTWWSGLPAGEARKALESVKRELLSENIESRTYWFKDLSTPTPTRDSLYLLPGFDEFIISYKDRSPSLASPHHGTAIASNGIFRPMVVYNGQVIGLWKKKVLKNKLIVETELFEKTSARKSKDLQKRIKEASEKMIAFYKESE